MGLFGFGKKGKVLDLTENYKRQVEKAEKARTSQKNSSSAAGPFSFFDSPAATSSSEETLNLSSGDEKKKRLAKRIIEMTEKVEDLSNQIYHLQQRLEVLERKNDVKRF